MLSVQVSCIIIGQTHAFTITSGSEAIKRTEIGLLSAAAAAAAAATTGYQNACKRIRLTPPPLS